MSGSIQHILDCQEGAPQALKEYMRKEELSLKEAHRKLLAGREITGRFTALVDSVLCGLFERLSLKVSVGQAYSVVALGGYGRQALNIRSDIDLMILYEGSGITPELEALTQKILYLMWDSGMDVGFSIRTVEECLEVAAEDTKTQTAFIDARHLWADKRLFERFVKRAKEELFWGKSLERFIEEKLEERRQRHARYGGSVFILEPNVKEGEGGLRDIHTALWVVKAKQGGRADFKELGLVSEKEARHLERAVDMLHWIRNELHFETGRKTDQLSFDHQERVAPLLGFKDTTHELSVEAFMRRYYEMAYTIKEVSDRILKRALDGDRKAASPSKKTPVDEDFYILDGLLFAEREGLFKENPVAVMRAFEYAQKHRVELHQSLRDMILSSLGLVEQHRESAQMAESFLNILRGGEVYPVLQEMHRLGVLGRYMPEFGAIRCKVQHDLYHIYTVDTHTLLAIRELDRLAGQYREEFPLLCRLFEELKDKMPLYLGVLLHDAGKALGRPHAIKGAELVPEVARRLGLDEDTAEVVSFLVREHLILADTAQHRDIHDEKLIIEFAKKVVDTERLNLLYLLTFADIRAVGPDVWNQWKGALFMELYFKAFKVIERGSFEPEDRHKKLASIRKRVEELATPWASAEDVAEYFRLLPPRYFLANSPEKIAKHIRVIKSLDEEPCVVDVEQVEDREYTELVVATYDVHGLFSMITGILSANSVNILGAQINTLRNGIALDVLQVNNAYGGLLTEPSKLKRIEEELLEAIRGRLHVDRLVREKCKRPSILDRKERPPVPTRIEVDNNVSDAFTVIDIRTQDRIGLLYDISSTLTKLSLFIYVAKISTRGEEATDIFYVRDIFGQKITDNKKIELIKDTLYRALTEDEATG